MCLEEQQPSLHNQSVCVCVLACEHVCVSMFMRVCVLKCNWSGVNVLVNAL